MESRIILWYNSKYFLPYFQTFFQQRHCQFNLILLYFIKWNEEWYSFVVPLWNPFPWCCRSEFYCEHWSTEKKTPWLSTNYNKYSGLDKNDYHSEKMSTNVILIHRKAWYFSSSEIGYWNFIIIQFCLLRYFNEVQVRHASYGFLPWALQNHQISYMQNINMFMNRWCLFTEKRKEGG
jgi:hypothetical protein